ncbi:PocR ligand-binding domain-containing protein [Halothermothrix orenii]|uniref:Helix-turn-helix-domain containing protein AraC type n=1 Tax=Halothermothrix orenii (strain H 168 / OCM 544 / DSM 9562) TaxID=373903 RepID=B8CYB7_HALOH|nr:PocR ligand-binding domain-containing protein [Halothermothrix orenii]ACL70286.1 helix-turn-helix- domain containing protein AraC type [Halothermothrix orenii H 168]
MINEKIKDKLKKVINIYSYATGIGCRIISTEDMKEVFQPPLSRPSFCKMVHSCSRCDDDCKQSYIYGGLQAEKLGEPYIYFCPYGLVNWAVPLFGEKKMEYFFTGGPVLLHPVDDLLIEDILNQNPLLGSSYRELREHLNKLIQVDTVRARYLSELLMELSKNVMLERGYRQNRKREYNSINARIAEKIHELKQGKDDEGTLYPIEKEQELIKKVKLGDKQGARAILNDILGFVYFQSGNKLDIIKAKAIELMVVLARAAIEVGADLEVIFGLENTYFNKIDNIEDVNRLSEILVRVLDRFIECIFSIKNVRKKDLMYKAMNYIRDNYAHKSISLNEVADEVGLSAAYFSKLFKEELGLTYTEYLNKVRIEASKELLKQGCSLASIAQTVGFNDQSYFSKVFKKMEGLSPGKWRG